MTHPSIFSNSLMSTVVTSSPSSRNSAAEREDAVVAEQHDVRAGADRARGEQANVCDVTVNALVLAQLELGEAECDATAQ